MRHCLTFLLIVITLNIHAQTNTDSLAKDVSDIKKKMLLMNWINKFNLSGYLQVQYQHADTAGAKSFAGGDFPVAAADRFIIRRGRVKLEFTNKNKKDLVNVYANVMVNFTETGINLVEYYGKVVDPFVNWVALTAGMQFRPFGHEEQYSDARRESPDLARMSQIILPKERDLGFMLTIEPPKTFKYNFFKINAGIFNGTGLGNTSISGRKDFIGQIVLHHELLNKHLSISGGASYYYGGVLQSTPSYYNVEPDAAGIMRYTKHTDSTGMGQRYFKREYIGLDAQMRADYSIFHTIVRGEYIWGKEPGTANNNATPIALGTDIYNRQFNGAYFYFIQGFHDNKHNIVHELTFKYDFYNPNTQVNDKNLSSTIDAKTSTADIKYQTFGIGYNIVPIKYFKFMIYYDIVRNDITGITGYTRDLKDNVLTVRTQFSF